MLKMTIEFDEVNVSYGVEYRVGGEDDGRWFFASNSTTRSLDEALKFAAYLWRSDTDRYEFLRLTKTSGSVSKPLLLYVDEES